MEVFWLRRSVKSQVHWRTIGVKLLTLEPWCHNTHTLLHSKKLKARKKCHGPLGFYSTLHSKKLKARKKCHRPFGFYGMRLIHYFKKLGTHFHLKPLAFVPDFSGVSPFVGAQAT